MSSEALIEPVQQASHIPLTSHVKRTARQGKHRVAMLTQALDLRDVAYKDGTDPKLPPHIRAAIMRAWVDLSELAMALRGQGKPKPVTARNDASATKRKPKTLAPLRKVEPNPSVPPVAGDPGRSQP